MNAVMWLHIAGGAVALAAGTVAVSVRKGRGVHAAAGFGFVVAMLVLSVTASVLGPFAEPAQSPVGGLVVCYFVATGWMAARRREGQPHVFEKIACAVVLAMAAAILWDGVQRAVAPPGQFPAPPPAAAVILLGALCLLAGLGDLRYLLRGALSQRQRISRHLWRMCFAFFIATGSFFLGQQDALPATVRGSALLFMPAFAPILVMLVALLRARLTNYPFAPRGARSQHEWPLQARRIFHRRGTRPSV